MTMTRRGFVAEAGAATLLAFAQPALAQAPRYKAVAFDGFPVFDLRPAFKLVAQEFPAQGDALRAAWFNKVFGYSWLITTSGRYMPFEDVLRRALRMVCAEQKAEWSQGAEDRIIDIMHNLPVWPDVKEGLARLKDAGVRLAFLSNLSERMLRAGMEANGIGAYFEAALSTDLVSAFKPSPKAYQMGVDHFRLPKEEIAFAAFGGWDATGAGWFGYPAIWVNRFGLPEETLGAPLLATDRGFDVIVRSVAKAG